MHEVVDWSILEDKRVCSMLIEIFYLAQSVKFVFYRMQK